jgi:hypothetical protein
MKKWEVSLIRDVPSYEVVCKEYRTRFWSLRFMRRNLGPKTGFYCGVLVRPGEEEMATFYWNGSRIVRWDKPTVLSSRQALEIEDDG